MSVIGSPRSESSIWVQWQAPSVSVRNGEILGYTVRYKPAGYPESTLIRQNVTNLNNIIELQDLIVFTEYEVAVAAYNAKGVGVYSDYIRVRTHEGTPSAPPNNVQANAVNSTTILLAWDPPASPTINGINQGYIVTLARLDAESTDNSATKQVTIPSTPENLVQRQSIVLTDLFKYTEYSVSVLCFTSKGNGPASDDLVVRTLEDGK